MLLNLFLILSLSFVFTICQPKEETSANIKNADTQCTDSDLSDPNEEEKFTCDYMGQNPPLEIAITNS